MRSDDDSRTIAACPRSARMAQQPALSALEPDLAVLGRKYRSWALCRRPRAADDAVLYQVDRGVFDTGIALIGPNRAAPFFHLVPVFGSAMAILLPGEQPRLYHLVGYVLVLAGVVIASRQASAAG